MMKRLLIALALAAGAAFGQPSGCTNTPYTGTAWTSATSSGASQIMATAVTGTQVLVTLDQSATITAGAITFQGDYGDGNWVAVPPSQIINSVTGQRITNPYTLAVANQAFTVTMAGFYRLELVLSTPITGSGTVTPYATILCYGASFLPLDTQGNLLADIATAPGVTNILQQLLAGITALRPSPLSSPLRVVEAAAAPQGNVCNGPLLPVPVSTSSNAQLIPGLAGRTIHLCTGGVLVVTTAGSFSLVEGIGATCGTNTLAVIGSTTAANGVPLAANQGFLVNGGMSVVPGNNVCLLLTGTGLIAGNLQFAYSY
jgi:hypothetical protein